MLQQADNAAAMLPEVKSLYVHLHDSPPFISPGWEVLMFKVLEHQSPLLSRTQTQDFLRRFEAFFLADARYDLWVRSASSGGVIVWDRHNDLCVYGGLVDIADRLMQLGFQEGLPPSIGPHQHHYRREFDGEAAEVLSSFNWHRTPLRPEDQQFSPPPSE
jgi:hypothetical protein